MRKKEEKIRRMRKKCSFHGETETYLSFFDGPDSSVSADLFSPSFPGCWSLVESSSLGGPFKSLSTSGLFMSSTGLSHTDDLVLGL